MCAERKDTIAYYDRNAQLIRELEDADQSFSTEHVLPKGCIRIDVIGTLARLFIIPALPEFFARYPDMQIDFRVSDKSADMIGDNIDCVIRGDSAADLSMVARLLGTTSWTTCATPGYLTALRLSPPPLNYLSLRRRGNVTLI